MGPALIKPSARGIVIMDRGVAADWSVVAKASQDQKKNEARSARSQNGATRKRHLHGLPLIPVTHHPCSFSLSGISPLRVGLSGILVLVIRALSRNGTWIVW